MGSRHALLLAVAAWYGIGDPAHAAPADRVTLPLSEGWRFKQDDAVRGAEAPGYPDADWAHVTVPHTWNRVGYYLPDPQMHVNTRETIDKTQGVGWYRLSFTPPVSFAGKRAWLQFDAASRIATVWLNGVLIGTHEGGFARFRLDATGALRPGKANLLVVKTDNSKPESGAAAADILPLAGDFFVYGGLYRAVSLIATDPVHVDMLDFGGAGVYATTQSVDGARATVRVSVKLRNDGASAMPVQVVTRLIDRSGHIAAENTRAIALDANAGSATQQDLDLASVHLWRGVVDPYLYRLVVEIRGAGNRLLDRIEQAYGVRTMRIDPARGFFLNGEPYPLHGVGYHQDREGKGWAILPSDVAQDVATLREMGANSIRLTHYQHGQTIHDLADRYGLVVWDEIPLVSQWTLGGAKEASPGLVANARQQLTEEIRQNGNHASVANWGIANEVDFGNSQPSYLGGATGTPPDPLPLLHELSMLAHQLDPSRPTSLATCCEDRLFAAGVAVPETAPAADIGGANRYFGWYYGKPGDLGAALDALHAKRPQQPLAVTEYGAGGATTIHTDDVRGGPVDARGRMQPEEVESWIHEENWAALAARPYLWATWLWNSFDFASTVRAEGDAQDINTKGLVSFDRKIRKDAYYFYKANWATTPTVYITGRRYVERAYSSTEVRVYSNAPTTELTVNGKAISTLAACPQRVCVWRDVRLSPGDNRIVARGRFAAGPVEDRIAWHVADDVAHAIRIDSGAMVAATSSSGRFGSDAFFVGGEPASVDKPADYGKPAQPATITGTPDTALAASYRKGAFRYAVPLDDGRYLVTLTFVEPAAAPGERVFDVIAGGEPVLRSLDVAKAAGAPLAALRRSFPVDVRGGKLTLDFRPIKGDAIVSAVEITR